MKIHPPQIGTVVGLIVWAIIVQVIFWFNDWLHG